MATGTPEEVGIGNSVTDPVVVMRPIAPGGPPGAPLGASVNQIAPSGPTVSAVGNACAVGTWNWLTTPEVVSRPIVFRSVSVNQRLPSGPAMIKPRLTEPLIGNSTIEPLGVILPMLGPVDSVN